MHKSGNCLEAGIEYVGILKDNWKYHSITEKESHREFFKRILGNSSGMMMNTWMWFFWKREKTKKWRYWKDKRENLRKGWRDKEININLSNTERSTKR